MDPSLRLVKWTQPSRISSLVDRRRGLRRLAGASLAALLALVTPAQAGRLHPASSRQHAVRGRWLVLRSAKAPALSSQKSWAEVLGGRGRVVRAYESALRGALVELPDELAAELASQPEVEGVFQDVTLPEPFSAPLPDCSVGVALSVPAPVPANPQPLSCSDPNPQQPSATCVDNWGLDRLDGTSVARDGVYAPPRTGAGVHLFVVDTGLYAQHQDFIGRVGTGTDATGGGGTTADCGAWSHGTHVAGIAAGTRFGVAKGAVVHPVRVSSCTEGLQISSLVTAFDWIAQVHRTSVPGPAVATMSINVATPLIEFNDPTQPLGVAIAGALAAGVLVIESAGNQSEDACGHVARVPGMLLVGGSDELDTPGSARPAIQITPGGAGAATTAAATPAAASTCSRPRLTSCRPGSAATPTRATRVGSAAPRWPHRTLPAPPPCTSRHTRRRRLRRCDKRCWPRPDPGCSSCPPGAPTECSACSRAHRRRPSRTPVWTSPTPASA